MSITNFISKPRNKMVSSLSLDSSLNPNASIFSPSSNSLIPNSGPPVIFQSSQRPTPSTKSGDELSIIHLNARSILPKISELSQLANNLFPHVIAVTKTWLSPSVANRSVTFPGFTQVFRTDRPNDRSTLLLARDDVTIKDRSDLHVWPGRKYMG